MKISMFHLMPYRFLPPDFENRYRSVWVDVPHELYDARKAGELYNEFLDELELAEQVGFDGLCVNDACRAAGSSRASRSARRWT